MRTPPDAQPERPGPHPWPTWPQVALGKHAKITFTSPGRDREVVGRDLLSQLFAIGLLVDPTKTPQVAAGREASLHLTLKGRGRFMVGNEDLGARRGLKVVGRGLVHVLEQIAADAQPASPDDRTTSTRATPSGPRRGGPRTVVTVTVEQAQESLEALVDLVQGGVRVMIAVPDGRHAVLAGWSSYAKEQERLALAIAADWGASRTGRFDTARYANAMNAAGLRLTGGIHPAVDNASAPGEEAGDDRSG